MGCVPAFGAGWHPCPEGGLWGRIWADFEQGFGTGARGDEEQEKALALLCARAVTTARSAGGFGGRKLALFRNARTTIDAVFQKTGEYPRSWDIFADAITDSGGA